MKKTAGLAFSLLLLLLLLAPSMASPQVGTAFTYQGRLTDAAAAANGTYDIEVKLFDALTAGVQIGSTLTLNDVVVAGGLFTVNLDFGASAFTGSRRWLEMGVRPGISPGAYTLLSPRQELTPSPNAVFSASAGAAASVTGIVPIANGGTGSATQSFVDLTTAQTVGGNKTLTGNLVIGASTATMGNIMKGANPFIHNFGTNNTFVGQNAGNFTMTGTDNTASGLVALQNNTTGGANTASGAFALSSNTTGSYNTASGLKALDKNTTGIYNTASGVFALRDNTAGIYNTASGVFALRDNTTGNFNTASGRSALENNTTGSGNTAAGDSSLFNNTTGTNNTVLGFQANVGVNNLTNATAIGSGAIVGTSNTIQLGNAAIVSLRAQVGLTIVSDRTKKENFRDVDAQAVLQRLRGIGVTSWNYIGHDPKEFRHYGPMAQDFFAAFGRDEVGAIGTDTTINSGDITAILMIGLKGLDAQMQKDQRTIAAQAARIVDLEGQMAEIADLRQQLAAVMESVKTLSRSSSGGPRRTSGKSIE